MMTNPAVDRHLVELVESMTSWALAEANLAHDLGRPDVYLGGDGLRPYVTWSDDGVVRVAGRQPPHLPAPKLVDELIAGSHGLASVTRDPDRPESYALTLPRVASLTNRLDVPELLLVGHRVGGHESGGQSKPAGPGECRDGDSVAKHGVTPSGTGGVSTPGPRQSRAHAMWAILPPLTANPKHRWHFGKRNNKSFLL